MDNKKIILKKIERNETENYGTALAALCHCLCICFRTFKPNFYSADVVLYVRGGV